jgi:hypothetical protein
VISIIICTREQDIPVRLKTNIESTVGITHEIVVVSNPNRRYGICQAYNMGARLAQYPILCFMHDDLEFVTNNWGKYVKELLASDQRIGLIGLAGGMYKSIEISGWGSGARDLEPKNITEVRPSTGQAIKHEFNSSKGAVTDVVAIDGLWMCCPHWVWNDCQFDEELLVGFHGYDIDFSLQVYQKYRVVVTTAIPVLHHTAGGNFGKEWFDATRKVNEKWQLCLPAQTTQLTPKKHKQLDWRICRNYFFCAFYYGTKDVSDFYFERCREINQASFISKISLYVHFWLGKNNSLFIQEIKSSLAARLKKVLMFVE